MRSRSLALPVAVLVGAAVTAQASGVATAHPERAAQPSQTAAPRTDVAPLPLGAPGLSQSQTEQSLAPGVTLTTVVRGQASRADTWVLRSLQATKAAADDLATRIRLNGYPAGVQRIDARAADDPVTGPLGWLVVSAGYPTEAAAKQAQAALAVGGVTGLGVSNTALYSRNATGPWVVRILTVRRQHLAQVHARLATDIVPGKETTSSVAQRLGALAATNGGYFVVGTADGVPGDPAGVAVQDGRYDSEPVADRAALVLQRNGARAERVTSSMQLTAPDGATTSLGGTDRAVGVIRDCGGPGDIPTVRPQQDVTCTNANEIVTFDRSFGTTADTGPGVAVTLDSRRRVLAVAPQRGGAIPYRGQVIEGIGAGADWLTAHAHRGEVLTVASALLADGHRLRLTSSTGIVNGGPFLVRHGRQSIDAWQEGFVHPGDPGFYFGFAVSRNPRTMAGITRAGDLLVVTVDGRAPGYSIGMSFAEQAGVLRALGARDALNLDGGGSTAMVVRGELLGRPSDTTGERPVGDVLAVLPQQRAGS